MSEPRIAAIVYDRTDPVDTVLAGFAERLAAHGRRVAGLVDADPAPDACITREMALRDLSTGAVTSICQDLGANARGCRIDPRGLAEAGALLRAGLAARPDCVIVNKFGKMEADGLGLADEIGHCVAEGVPLVIGVPRRFLDAWNAFAGGLDTPLACDAAALDAWWTDTAAEPAGR
ncbi:DUF2478 domain-containing protein [Salinarimonas sp.]|uniref:DUF2478 domain-containing protein n=1 Tax=Salinarimonas sp. TaxID=2766526 RepID=UPI0032D8C839